MLPSQQGFTEDLQATNVITPIIDLTPSAEGDLLGPDLQQALAHGSQTTTNIANATNTVVINTTGFYRLFGVGTLYYANATVSAHLELFDGSTAKRVFDISSLGNSNGSTIQQVPFDFIVFLASGESVRATSNNVLARIAVTTRQIADVNGNLVNPSGFTAS